MQYVCVNCLKNIMQVLWWKKLRNPNMWALNMWEYVQICEKKVFIHEKKESPGCLCVCRAVWKGPYNVQSFRTPWWKFEKAKEKESVPFIICAQCQSNIWVKFQSPPCVLKLGYPDLVLFFQFFRNPRQHQPRSTSKILPYHLLGELQYWAQAK